MWNVMCNVSEIRIDVINHRGELFLPENNCPDMSHTVSCFLSVDPKIDAIQTYIGGKPDIAYVCADDGRWIAYQTTE